VEGAELVFADAAGEDGDVVDVGVVDHGVESGFEVAGSELVLGVLFSEGFQLLRRHARSLVVVWGRGNDVAR
jgi:hypothetical protein